MTEEEQGTLSEYAPVLKAIVEGFIATLDETDDLEKEAVVRSYYNSNIALFNLAMDTHLRISTGLKPVIPENPEGIDESTIKTIWQSIFGTSGGDEPWWISWDIVEGTWDTPGKAVITAEDPKEEGNTITKIFTALDLAKVYRSMPPGTSHCGGDNIIGDSADACTFDIIMQWAFFGEEVYG